MGPLEQQRPRDNRRERTRMPEDSKSPSNFKVVDRRTFSEDGSVRERSAEDETTGPVEIRGARQSSAPSRPATAPRPREPEPAEFTDEQVDQGFETLISYLSTTA